MSKIQYVFLFIAIAVFGFSTIFTLPLLMTSETWQERIPSIIFGSIFGILIFLGIIGVFG